LEGDKKMSFLGRDQGDQRRADQNSKEKKISETYGIEQPESLRDLE